jgi:hypothetical protein
VRSHSPGPAGGRTVDRFSCFRSNEAMAEQTTVERLSPAERRDLAQLEATIAAGKACFRDVALAMLEIRERRLYRERFATFHDYCREQLGFAGSHGDRIAECVYLIELCAELGLPAPENAQQAKHVRRVLKIKRGCRPGTYKADAPAEEDVQRLREVLGEDGTEGYQRLAKLLREEPTANGANGVSETADVAGAIEGHLQGLERIHAVHPYAAKGNELLAMYRSTVFPWREE